MARSSAALAVALLVGLTTAGPAWCQSDLLQRLESDRLGMVKDGTYQAADDITFSLNRDGSHYLLRFAGQREVFVLYADNASLGGRVLKYDSGKTALQITSWGAMTLYTDAKPSGLPVMRTGDATPPVMAQVSLAALKATAAAEAQKLAATHRLALTFQARWDKLAADAPARAECLDALENAAGGIGRFAAQRSGQEAVATQIRTVLVIGSGKPTLQRQKHELIVTFVPGQGYVGRASSRAIARALHMIFQLPGKD